MFDKNGDGMLTLEELENVFAILSGHASEQQYEGDGSGSGEQKTPSAALSDETKAEVCLSSFCSYGRTPCVCCCCCSCDDVMVVVDAALVRSLANRFGKSSSGLTQTRAGKSGAHARMLAARALRNKLLQVTACMHACLDPSSRSS